MVATDHTSDRPTITQFTDPMCTWCWGSEPIIRRIHTTYGNQVQMRYVMGGLVEDFEEFYDPANDISSPGDVGPHWVEASNHHGMPVDTTIFGTDPAQSTYPASIAFVAARQQDVEKANRYLRRLREAYATEVRNVNRREVQIELAKEVGLDIDRFRNALSDGSAEEAFENDLAQTQEAGVRSFPTYRVVGPEDELMMSGYVKFDQFATVLEEVAPRLERTSPPPIGDFVADYGPVATREVAEVYQLADGKARQVLGSLAEEGQVEKERRGNGLFWRETGGGS